jgi:hypothetical protein
MLERGVRALLAEVRDALVALCDRRLALAIGLFAALLLIIAQTPFSYHIAIGQEDGIGSDLPLVTGFYPPEHDIHGNFRWTSARALIRLPGIGQRALQVALDVFPINDEVVQRGPHEIELWADGRLLGRLPVRQAGALYQFVVPPPVDRSGDQVIELRSSTFVPAGDQRSIGVPIDDISVGSGFGLRLPAWGSSLTWIIAAVLLWLALRRAGFESATAQLLLLAGLLLACVAAALDPPRFAFGARPALTAIALGWLLILALNAARPALLTAAGGLALLAAAAQLLNADSDSVAALAGLALALLLAGLLRPVISALHRRLNAPIAPQSWRWLLLIALVVFTTRYGGKIYPDSMPGDIGFHANRYADVVRGEVLLLSRNRGVDFPYPPALYLLLAPIALLGSDRGILLQLTSALLDALSPLLIYSIATRTTLRPTRQRLAPRDAYFATLAAAIYSFTAAGFLTTWWNFSTHIFTQFAHLLLITVIILLWRPAHGEQEIIHRPPELPNPPLDVSFWWAVAALVVLQLLVYLGHFGYWINMSLLGALALLAALRGRSSWPAFRPALLSFVVAQALAVLFFYSGYTGLFLAQARVTATSGLTGLADRAATDQALLWDTLWDAGFRVHFGFFPVPLALGGLLLLGYRTARNCRAPAAREKGRRRIRWPSGPLPRAQALLVLMAGTFLIGLLFAVLPFVSGSTLSTRWLMFSAWAVAVGAAAGAQLLWRSGRAGRLLVIVMSWYVVWVTASVWLTALAWRVRPPEPF